MTRLKPVINRLLARVQEDENGCWVWQGALDSKGYGHIYAGPGAGVARCHRVTYQHYVGPIPDGLDIDHLCRNRKCSNPAHLEAVTRRVNLLRGEGPAAANARKLHCDQGHQFDKIDPTRGRYCSVCKRVRRARSAVTA